MIRAALFAFLGAIGALTYVTGINHVGNLYIYLLFTLLANALLLNGFRRQALFFDTFIGIFLWLGFWLKFSIRVAFSSGIFHEPVGAFDDTAEAFDRALAISCCGIAAVLAASLIRERFFSYPAVTPVYNQSGLLDYYQRHRKAIVVGFALFVAFVATTNSWLGIYQRGVVVQTHLPYGLNGIYKWLLQFGLASFCALIIRFELEINRKFSAIAIAAPIFETLFSNTSLLSRGMVLNFSALAFGAHRMRQALQIRVSLATIAIVFAVFTTSFAASVLTVNYLRASWQITENENYQYQAPSRQKKAYANKQSAASIVPGMTTPLFIDRWVGIEGVMAVSSYEHLGWDLWREAWQEKFREGTLSLYDRYFIESPYEYAGIDRAKNHYISLPGIIAFLFYPGSWLFLFFAMLGCALAAALIEIGAYRLCGHNLILCSLFGQVIAFRFTSIGYVPNQSYLLFGSLLLNILIIFCLERFFRHRLRPPKN